MWILAGRDPELFWRMSMCQIVHALEAQTGGRRRGRDGKVSRKGTKEDVFALAARFGNVRLIDRTAGNNDSPPSAT